MTVGLLYEQQPPRLWDIVRSDAFVPIGPAVDAITVPAADPLERKARAGGS